MKHKIKIGMRAAIRICLFAFIAVAVPVVFAISSCRQCSNASAQLKLQRSRSAQELCSYVESIDTLLKKSLYTATPESFSALSTQLLQNTSCAKCALEALPVSGEKSATVNRFLSQVGDYSAYLAECSAQNKKPEDAQSSLTKLSQYCNTLKNICANMSLDIANGLDFSSDTEEIGQSSFAVTDGLYQSDEKLSSYPTLIYDGPFSDSVYQKEPLYTQNAKAVTSESVLEKAFRLCEKASRLNYKYEENGTVPCYVFCGSNYSIAVTQSGGYPLYMNYDHRVNEAAITKEKAEKRAQAMLKRLGYGSFKLTGYEIYQNICTFNFAYYEDEIIYYPDLIKISVALDDGDITAFDARAFVMNHTQREFTVKKSEAEAKGMLSGALSVCGCSLAVIPLDQTGEALCYEFKCKGSGEDTVLAYINAEDLKEEKILIVLQSDTASLTI